MAFADLPPFESSNIRSARYDEAAQVFEITFLNGGTYQYFDVPTMVVEGFEQADSKGSYLAARIKGHYRYSRV